MMASARAGVPPAWGYTDLTARLDAKKRSVKRSLSKDRLELPRSLVASSRKENSAGQPA